MILDQTRLLKADHGDKQPDARGGGKPQGTGYGRGDQSAGTRYRERKEHDRDNQYDTETGTPVLIHCVDREYEERVEAHTGSERDGQVGDESHEKRGQSAGQNCRQDGRLHRHTGDRQNLGIDDDNVGHRQEGRESPENLTAHRRPAGPDFEDTFEKIRHGVSLKRSTQFNRR